MVGDHGLDDTAVRPFRIDVPTRCSTICVAGSRTPAGRKPRPGRRLDARASRSARCRTSAATGPTATTGGRARPRSTASTSSSPTIDGLDIHFIHAALAPRRRHAAGDHPRLARVDRRVPQGDRAADRPDRARRRGRRRVPRGLPVAAGLRVLAASPTTTGWGVERIAEAWAALMARLGYDRYVAQGGDWGSAVTTCDRRAGRRPLRRHPRHAGRWARGRRLDGDPTPEEQRALERRRVLPDWDSGYSKQQARGPRPLATASPIRRPGQAAWILEKFWAWTDCDGHPENVLTRDELLDNVMLYWADRQRARLGPPLLGELRQRLAPAHRRVPVGRGGLPEGDRHAGARVGRRPTSRHPPLGRADQGRPLRRLRAARLFVADIRTCFRQFR